MKLNTTLTKEEQTELTSDIDYNSLFNKHDYRKAGYLPEYVREAMRKNGVIRNISGKFVKVGIDKTMNI